MILKLRIAYIEEIKCLIQYFRFFIMHIKFDPLHYKYH
jgi:hypothetical protein